MFLPNMLTSERLMKIAILGTGNVGGTLGTCWAKKGHEVIYGVRNPHDPDLKALIETSSGKTSAVTLKEVAACADVIILAVPWNAAQEVLQNLGDLRGKTLLDCTNPLAPNLAGLTLGQDTSGAEQIAKWLPGANVVKIFNTTGAENIGNPIYPEGPSLMLYCGDNAEAKASAAQLALDLGFDVYDLGPLTGARLLEPWALVWIQLAVKLKIGRNFAFRLVHR